MKYYFDGIMVSLEFNYHKAVEENLLPNRYFGLEKIVKEYPDEDAIDILYHKNGEVKFGIALYKGNGMVFGKGLWVIPAYFKFRKVVQSLQ